MTPRSVVRRVVRGAIRLVLRLPRLRAAVAAEVGVQRRSKARPALARRAKGGLAAEARPPGASRRRRRRASDRNAGGARPAVPTAVEGRTFVDRRGVSHVLDPGLRDRLKPAWRQMCDPVLASQPPSDELILSRLRKAARSVAEADRWLRVTAGAGLNGRILEIGCYDGAIAVELARGEGTSVVASDMARYYVVQRPGDPMAEAIEAEQVRLAELRARVEQFAGVAPGAVTFVEDDVTQSNLEPGSFDIVVSFEVLEHVTDPDAAARSIHRLLRAGGLTYHDYNPFFSVNGGHSLGTLDVPWGHARFDAADVERYLREIRPDEAEQALRFYRQSLNRMTLADLRGSLERAGLELLAVVPWHERRLIEQLPAGALAEVTAAYPSATAADLLATFVTVVARRPA
jgi:SAM-dependent methyltransferase